MKKFRHWKYQIMLAAPFLPWLLVQHFNVTYRAGLALEWDPVASAIFTIIATFAALALFFVGYFKLHERDDD